MNSVRRTAAPTLWTKRVTFSSLTLTHTPPLHWFDHKSDCCGSMVQPPAFARWIRRPGEYVLASARPHCPVAVAFGSAVSPLRRLREVSDALFRQSCGRLDAAGHPHRRNQDGLSRFPGGVYAQRPLPMCVPETLEGLAPGRIDPFSRVKDRPRVVRRPEPVVVLLVKVRCDGIEDDTAVCQLAPPWSGNQVPTRSFLKGGPALWERQAVRAALQDRLGDCAHCLGGGAAEQQGADCVRG